MGGFAFGDVGRALSTTILGVIVMLNCGMAAVPVAKDTRPSVEVVAASPTQAATEGFGDHLEPLLPTDFDATKALAEGDAQAAPVAEAAPTADAPASDAQALDAPALDAPAAAAVAAAKAVVKKKAKAQAVAVAIPTHDEIQALRKRRLLSEADVVHILRYHGFPERDIPALVCTVKNESSFIAQAHNINAVDGSHDTGLFQINDLWLSACKMTRRDLNDPVKNVKCARKVYEERGLRAWLGFTRKHECRTYQLADAD